MESVDFSARTDDGRRYRLDKSNMAEKCVVHCEDGNFTMPKMRIVFPGGERMKELEILLNRRWILKSEDKELYYRVRDAVRGDPEICDR